MAKKFGAPLFIIAGFPAPLSQIITSSLKRDSNLKHAFYVQAASSRNGPLYEDSSANALLQETWAQIRRQDESNPKQIEPSRLILLYVPDPSASTLLDAFGFSCFPIPIQVEPKNRHLLRKDPNFSAQILKQLVKQVPSNIIRLVEEEISYKMRKTLFLLPPNNFIEPNNRQSIRQWFVDILNDPEEWHLVSQRLSLTPLTNDQVSGLRGKRGRAFVDSRNLCFLPADAREEHGRLRVPREGQGPEVIRHWLNGKFRFGIPINGEGFHYDVQKIGGGNLRSLQFECEVQGKIQTENSYINIYPNDFIRR